MVERKNVCGHTFEIRVLVIVFPYKSMHIEPVHPDNTLHMKWLRTADGFMCFGFAVFFAVASLQPFYLAPVVVTDVISADYNAIVHGMSLDPVVRPSVCNASYVSPALAADASVQIPCSCLDDAKDSTSLNECMRKNHGLPAEQVRIGRMNPNYLLFHVFLVSALYQLVIRNSLQVDMSRMNRDVQIAVTMLCFGMGISAVMSLFDYDNGVSSLVILNFLPHQFTLLLVAFVMFNNAHFPEIDASMREKYKAAIFSGCYNIATLPFISLFVCSVNAWTTMPMLQFNYSASMLLAVVQLAYHCVFIDSSETSPNPAAKIRMRQAVYLLLVTVLTAMSIVMVQYLPLHGDTVHRVLTIGFISTLWVVHILFDCTRVDIKSYMYQRNVKMYDACLATARYMALFFSFYVVWGIGQGHAAPHDVGLTT